VDNNADENLIAEADIPETQQTTISSSSYVPAK
jgi:hypothetical protein